MGISFRHSAGFGKRMEYNLVGQMLMEKRYGRAWKRIRDKYASEYPFCELEELSWRQKRSTIRSR